MASRGLISGAWWYRNPGSPGGAWQRNVIGNGLDPSRSGG